MCRIFLVFVALFIHANTFSQENIYDILGLDMVDTSDYDGKVMFYEELPFNLLNKLEVDKHVEHDVLKANSQHFRTLGDVSAFLVKNKSSDYQKIRAFFRWISLNIEFDSRSYLSNHYPPQHPLVVFQNKRALPKGFADLFTIFCQNNDIECRSLKGFARGFDPLKEKKDNPNHYWNVVRIDGYWYLLDVVMCLGKMQNNVFLHSYSEDFFLVPPSDFIKTHLPIHASWQLLENHVGLDAFYQ